MIISSVEVLVSDMTAKAFTGKWERGGGNDVILLLAHLYLVPSPHRANNGFPT
jgi:hypothetical protein